MRCMFNVSTKLILNFFLLYLLKSVLEVQGISWGL